MPALKIKIVFLLSLLAFSFSTGLCAETNEHEISLSVEEAVLRVLENNSTFKVERMKPDITVSKELQARAAFDLSLSGAVSTTDRKTTSGATSEQTSEELGISKSTASGSSVSMDLSLGKSVSDTAGKDHSSQLRLSLTKPLLKGAGAGVNLFGLRQAELNTQVSRYELQRSAELLVADVEETYWDYAVAQRNLEIYEKSLDLAEQQLHETEVMVEVGRLAEIELVAARAVVASRKVKLIDARGSLEGTRLTLLRLLNPSEAGFWDMKISLEDPLAMPDAEPGDVESSIATALDRQPLLNKARLDLEQNELSVVRTKNGLLPYLDFFVSAGKTGYADTFKSSIGDLDSGGRDLNFKLELKQPLGNRVAREQHRQSLISKEQQIESLKNLELLAQQDIRMAWIEINRSKEQIAATEAWRILQEENLRAETEKFRVGRSTALQVAQVEQDLVESRISEAQAVSSYLKTLVRLFSLEGTLLEKHGISFLDS